MSDFIFVNRVYRSATPRVCDNGYVNDRLVVAVNLPGGDVMFDSPSIPRKRGRFGRCTLAAFKAWAGSDVTEQLNGTWQKGLSVVESVA